MNLFKTKVILDTNILLAPGKLGIDIFSEIDKLMDERYSLYTFESVIKELQSLIDKDKSQTSFNAKLGYVMANEKKVKILSSKTNYADKCIKDFSEKNKCVVVTQDRELHKIVKSHKNKTIGIRQQKYLAFY